MNTAQIHRFGDTVAMYLSNGETVYMTPTDAQAIAKQLNACARDVKACAYGAGSFATANIELVDTGYNGTNYTIKRAAK